jgi:predicted nucleotidyltransferase
MAEEKLTESDRILEEMVRRLVTAFHPDYIYLYGSRARGEAGPDSDYDLMMVVPSSQIPRYRRDQQAFRALCGMGVPKEVIVLTRAEFEAGQQVTCSLPATVLREGRLLYAA